MAINLPEQERINQYTANGSTTTFNYDYLILQNSDIDVYVTAPGATPDPNVDKKVLNVDYTVTGAVVTDGGTVVFTSAPANGATVTLASDIQYSIETNFAAMSTLNGANLDSAFQRVTMMVQQLASLLQDRGIKYKINEILGQTPPIPEKTLMPPPQLTGDVWMWDQEHHKWVIFNFDPSGGGGDISVIAAQLRYLIQTAGITVNFSDQTQTAKAVSNYESNGSYYTDSGTANEYVPVRVSGQNFVEPTQLIEGLTIDFQPLNTNTSTNCTVNFLGQTKPLNLALGNTGVPVGFIKGASSFYNPIYRLKYSADNDWWSIISAPEAVQISANLSSETSGSDGARLVGYNNGAGYAATVHDELIGAEQHFLTLDTFMDDLQEEGGAANTGADLVGYGRPSSGYHGTVQGWLDNLPSPEDLSSTTAGSDGARLIGYNNGAGFAGTVHDELIGVESHFATLDTFMGDLQEEGGAPNTGADLVGYGNGGLHTTVKGVLDQILSQLGTLQIFAHNVVPWAAGGGGGYQAIIPITGLLTTDYVFAQAVNYVGTSVSPGDSPSVSLLKIQSGQIYVEISKAVADNTVDIQYIVLRF